MACKVGPSLNEELHSPFNADSTVTEEL